jgi:hypothetical protein
MCHNLNYAFLPDLLIVLIQIYAFDTQCLILEHFAGAIVAPLNRFPLPRDHHPEWVVIPPPNIVRLKSVTALRFFNHFRRQCDPHRVLINEHE